MSEGDPKETCAAQPARWHPRWLASAKEYAARREL